MALTTPIIDLIGGNINTTINNVTVANGYNYDLSCVRPSKSDIQTPWQDREVLVNQVEFEELEDEMGLENWQQFFLIVVWLRDSDTDTTPIDTRRNRIVADCEKELKKDLTRGGYGRDTNFHGGTMFDTDDGALGGIVLKISVDYATLYNDPYTKG